MAELDTSALAELVAPTDDQLSAVSKLANQQLALERDIEQLSAELTQKKNLFVKVSQVDLPDAMTAINMQSFKLGDGTAIDIKKGVSATIKVADRPIAYSWLRAHHHGAIIKNTVNVPFGGGQDELAQEVKDFLDAKELEYDAKIAIHPGTLNAWAKAQLEAGNEIPEAINAFEYSVAKVTTP